MCAVVWYLCSFVFHLPNRGMYWLCLNRHTKVFVSFRDSFSSSSSPSSTSSFSSSSSSSSSLFLQPRPEWLHDSHYLLRILNSVSPALQMCYAFLFPSSDLYFEQKMRLVIIELLTDRNQTYPVCSEWAWSEKDEFSWKSLTWKPRYSRKGTLLFK